MADLIERVLQAVAARLGAPVLLDGDLLPAGARSVVARVTVAGRREPLVVKGYRSDARENWVREVAASESLVGQSAVVPALVDTPSRRGFTAPARSSVAAETQLAIYHVVRQHPQRYVVGEGSSTQTGEGILDGEAELYRHHARCLMNLGAVPDPGWDSVDVRQPFGQLKEDTIPKRRQQLFGCLDLDSTERAGFATISLKHGEGHATLEQRERVFRASSQRGRGARERWPPLLRCRGGKRVGEHRCPGGDSIDTRAFTQAELEFVEIERQGVGGVHEQPATSATNDRQSGTIYCQGRDARLTEFGDHREHGRGLSSDVRDADSLAVVMDIDPFA